MPLIWKVNTAFPVLFVGVPVKLGKNGIEQIISLKLTADEKKALDKSAAAVQELVDAMKKMAIKNDNRVTTLGFNYR